VVKRVSSGRKRSEKFHCAISGEGRAALAAGKEQMGNAVKRIDSGLERSDRFISRNQRRGPCCLGRRQHEQTGNAVKRIDSGLERSDINK
jgi:hypothetical protein